MKQVHAHRALLTPDRGMLVHDEKRIGELGRDSLGDTYILESCFEQGALQSAVVAAKSPDLGLHLLLLGGGLPGDLQSAPTAATLPHTSKLDASIFIFGGDRQLAHLDLTNASAHASACAVPYPCNFPAPRRARPPSRGAGIAGITGHGSRYDYAQRRESVHEHRRLLASSSTSASCSSSSFSPHTSATC